MPTYEVYLSQGNCVSLCY